MKRKTIAAAASVAGACALTLGTVAVAAPVASARGQGPRIVIDAPKKADAGTRFDLQCQASPRLVGKIARIREVGLPFHASRTVAANGSCDLWAIADAKGEHTFQVVIKVRKNKRVRSNPEEIDIV